MKLSCPAQCVARAQVLEYFSEQRKILRDDHIIFGFESAMEVGPAATLLLETCWEMGFEREIDAGLYLSGEAPEIMDFYPELLYYRDIVFLFKFMMTPEVEALPEVRPWLQTHAKLGWSYRAESGLTVKGFGGRTLKCIGAAKPREEGEESGWLASIKNLFTKATPRAPPSGADLILTPF
jgi:hypothetical protein